MTAFEADVSDQANQRGQTHWFYAAPGIVARELTLEVSVVPFNGQDRVIDQRGDFGASSLVLQVRPARFGRYPKYALGSVLVARLK